MKRRCPAVVLDLSGVLFIDSTGIAVLIEYLREASASGSQFVIAGLTEHVDHVFNIVRLDKAVPVFRTAVEAVRTLGNGGAPAPPEPLFTMVKAGHSAAGPTLVSA
jgi:anti-anti-sigma regulatory factor